MKNLKTVDTPRSRRQFLKASLGGGLAAAGLAFSANAENKVPAEQAEKKQPQQRWKVAGYMRMVPVTDKT
jgi:hypothetical protein